MTNARGRNPLFHAQKLGKVFMKAVLRMGGRASASIGLLAAGVLFATVLSLASTSSHALSSYYSALVAKYPAASANSCGNCHIDPAGGGSRNSYGTAFGNVSGHSSNPTAAITTIDPLDSDGDTVINSVELTAGTNPGVAGSTTPPVASTTNYIAFHDRNSSRYNENCLDCHAGVLTEKPVATATVTNPRLIGQPLTTTAHGTMLRGNFKPGRTGDDRRCQFCHRSVNLVEGPPMPQNEMNGAIRKRVDPAVCTLCHGPKTGTGAQPNSPGPQFYQVGLSQLIPLTNPLAAGQKLYGLYCAGCHNPLANSEVRGESAGEIQSHINGNEGGMGPLRVLTPAQIQAIATALGGSTSSGGSSD